MMKNNSHFEIDIKNKKSKGRIWIFVTIVLSILPFIYSTLLTYLGETWHLVEVTQKENGITSRGLSWWGIFATILMIVIICILTFFIKHKEFHSNEDKRQLEITKSGYDLFDKVLDTVGQICNRKYSTQMKTIENIKTKGEKPPKIYTKPCNQLEEILSELCDCIAYVLSDKSRKFNRNDIYASVTYNFPLENKNVWKWVNVNNEQGLSIDELVKDGTTFSHLLRNATTQCPSVFFNSKQDAFEKGNYVPDDCDKYDRNGKLKGSIACFKINLKKSDETYITAVLGISSYDKKFVDVPYKNKELEKYISQIDNVCKNIENVIVAELSERIKIELCNYYLQFLRDKWKEKNSKKFVAINKKYITMK